MLQAVVAVPIIKTGGLPKLAGNEAWTEGPIVWLDSKGTPSVAMFSADTFDLRSEARSEPSRE